MAHILETFRWIETRSGPDERRSSRPRRREALSPRDDARAAAHQGPPGHHALADGRRGGRGRPGPPHPVRQSRGLPVARLRRPPPLRQGAPRLFFRHRAHRGVPRQRPVRHGGLPAPPAVRARAPVAADLLFDARGGQQLLRGDRHSRGRDRSGSPRALPVRSHGGDRPQRTGRALSPRLRRHHPGDQPGLQPHPAPARGPRRHRHLARSLSRRDGARDRVAAARRERCAATANRVPSNSRPSSSPSGSCSPPRRPSSTPPKAAARSC